MGSARRVPRMRGSLMPERFKGASAPSSSGPSLLYTGRTENIEGAPDGQVDARVADCLDAVEVPHKLAASGVWTGSFSAESIGTRKPVHIELSTA